MKAETFETFRDPFGHFGEQLKTDKPSAINFLSYRKYKVTFEEIDEPVEVLLERLENLLANADGYNKRHMIKTEINRLKALNA